MRRPLLLAAAVVVPLLLVLPVLPLSIILMFGAQQDASAAELCASQPNIDTSNLKVSDLKPDQIANAGAIYSQALVDLPKRGQAAAIVGIAAALQESSLRNVNYGDKAGPDSRGLFQQRDPWGPLSVRMDPRGAAHLFFTGGRAPGTPGLNSIPNWWTLPVTAAAQRVQRSAFPLAYAKWEPLARELVTKLAGTAPGAAASASCTAGAIGDCPPESARPNYPNGEIPLAALCELKTAPGLYLRGDAAFAFDQMSRAYAKAFRRPIAVTDAYRDLATQIRLKQEKGKWAATPGTSNHGWGTAVDLGGGINSFGTAQRAWMVRNARKFGWISPEWAQPGKATPEPWHWEFTGRS